MQGLKLRNARVWNKIDYHFPENPWNFSCFFIDRKTRFVAKYVIIILISDISCNTGTQRIKENWRKREINNIAAYITWWYHDNCLLGCYLTDILLLLIIRKHLLLFSFSLLTLFCSMMNHLCVIILHYRNMYIIIIYY